MVEATLRRARGAVSALALVALAPACPAPSGPDGVVGREGVAAFQTETELVFSARVMVGSHFSVSAVAVDPEAPLPTDFALTSSDPAILSVGAPDADGKAPIELLAPGKADLQVSGGGAVVDAIAIQAALPGATALVDGDLLGASDVIDARLPGSGWGFLVDRDLTLLISALDRCGGDLLDLHASTVSFDGAPAGFTLEESGPATFTASSTAAAEVGVTLTTPGLEPLTYPIVALDPGAVDEVRVAAASADGEGNLGLWGRAFANDVEVVGPLRFTWAATERVALSAAEGLAVSVQVAFPGDGEPPDDRPATVTAEVFGEEGTLDLLTATQTISRGPPAREVPTVETTASSGCGAEACDPFAAAGLLGLSVLRLRRLRKPGSARLSRSGDVTPPRDG